MIRIHGAAGILPHALGSTVFEFTQTASRFSSRAACIEQHTVTQQQDEHRTIGAKYISLHRTAGAAGEGPRSSFSRHVGDLPDATAPYMWLQQLAVPSQCSTASGSAVLRTAAPGRVEAATEKTEAAT
jgi:hypothetical protein